MTTHLFDLQDEIAVVLGGTGALGGTIAAALAEAGARVVVVGRNAQKGLECVRGIEGAGGKAIFQTADALDRDLLSAACETITKKWGSPTVLVNAAGGNRADGTLPPGGDFCKLPLEAWRGVFDLNLVGGVVLPCQVFGQAMLAAGKGSIINIASMAGMIPLSRVVAYSAAKAAVINLTKFLAREWALQGIRVNSLSPGFFPGEQNKSLLFNADGSYTQRGGQIVEHTPLGRLGEPHELAGAVIWLSSPRASSFVTGQNIIIDGGFSSVTI